MIQFRYLFTLHKSTYLLYANMGLTAVVQFVSPPG